MPSGARGEAFTGGGSVMYSTRRKFFQTVAAGVVAPAVASAIPTGQATATTPSLKGIAANLRPLPLQRAFLESNAPYRGIYGPCGIGKTWAIIQHAVRLAKDTPRSRGLLVLRDQKVRWPGLRSLCADALRESGSDCLFSLDGKSLAVVDNGSRIFFESTSVVLDVRSLPSVDWFGVDDLQLEHPGSRWDLLVKQPGMTGGFASWHEERAMGVCVCSPQDAANGWKSL